MRTGDEVVLIGARGGERITAEEVAGRLGTINYEVTCGIGRRVRYLHVAVSLEQLQSKTRASGPRARRWRASRVVPGSSAGPSATRCSGGRCCDLDLAVDGDPGPAAKAIARALGGPVFRLSEEFGAWRVVLRATTASPATSSPLQGDSIEADLARRDFSVNAIAVAARQADRADRPAGRHPRHRRAHAARAGRRHGRYLVLRTRRAPPAAARAPGHGARLRAGRAHRAAHARGRARGRERLARADLRRAAPARDRRPRARGPRAGGPARADRRGAARAGRAPRRRAEPLPPPRRPRSHARGAAASSSDRARPVRRVRPRARRAGRRRSCDEPLADELTRAPGAPLRRAHARHRQAGHPRGPAERPRHVHRPRHRGRGGDRRDLPPPAHERAAARVPRRDRAPPPRARLPRARAPARPRRPSTATCARARRWRSR